jgi:hypothetical protein
MSDRHPSVTPAQLNEFPELAALEILDSALNMARVAIIAQHPELGDADPAAVPSTIEELAAAHVVNTVDMLQRVLESYRGAINTDTRWARLSLGGVADDPF